MWAMRASAAALDTVGSGTVRAKIATVSSPVERQEGGRERRAWVSIWRRDGWRRCGCGVRTSEDGHGRDAADLDVGAEEGALVAQPLLLLGAADGDRLPPAVEEEVEGEELAEVEAAEGEDGAGERLDGLASVERLQRALLLAHEGREPAEELEDDAVHDGLGVELAGGGGEEAVEPAGHRQVLVAGRARVHQVPAAAARWGKTGRQRNGESEMADQSRQSRDTAVLI